MDSAAFTDEMTAKIAAYCDGLAGHLPSYSYVGLADDAARIKVMKCRHWNEIRAAEVLGSWLKGTPEADVKAALGGAIAEEFNHSRLLAAALREKGADAYDYKPLPAQVAMFNAFEAVGSTLERMAAFPLAGEGVAEFMIERSLSSDTVPEWVRAPYRAIHADEEEHGSYPASVIAKYAKTDEQQDAVRRAVAMSLALRQAYFDNLDLWVYEDRAY
jgi:hypothetical protein